MQKLKKKHEKLEKMKKIEICKYSIIANFAAEII